MQPEASTGLDNSDRRELHLVGDLLDAEVFARQAAVLSTTSQGFAEAGLRNSANWAHNGGCWHAISITAACAMIALAALFVFRSRDGHKGGATAPRWVIGHPCAAMPDNGEMPTEFSCEKP
jgi:hypothetical protein